jgi:hypothetical protein
VRLSQLPDHQGELMAEERHLDARDLAFLLGFALLGLGYHDYTAEQRLTRVCALAARAMTIHNAGEIELPEGSKAAIHVTNAAASDPSENGQIKRWQINEGYEIADQCQPGGDTSEDQDAEEREP